MHNRLLRLLPAAAIVGLAAYAQTVIFPAKFEIQARPSKKVFLWNVQSSKATAYLLGSVHAARSSLYPLDERIEKAFDQSDTLVVEVNTAQASPAALVMQMTAKASYPQDDSLDKHVSKELLDLTDSRLAKYGFSVAPFKQFKPWFIATTLEAMELTALGITAANGVDQHFLDRAKDKKRILELESATEQLELLDSFSEKEQETFLKYTLKDLDNTGKNTDEIMTAWRNGDEKKLDALLNEAVRSDKELRSLYRRLINDRNKKMADKIQEFLSTDHIYFVVVGAGHLVGETGLLRTLGKKYQVKQL
jgi:hypothetical protein